MHPSIPSIFWSLICLCICRQSADQIELKFGGPTLYGPAQPVQLLVRLHWIPVVSWLLIGWSVSLFLETKCWTNCAQMWWAYSLWASPGLINFWSWSTEFLPFPGFWLVGQIPHICRQTADWIQLKFGGPSHFGTAVAWLTFVHAPQNPSFDSLSLLFNTPPPPPGQGLASTDALFKMWICK